MTHADLSASYYFVIQKAVEKLKEQNVIPQWIRLSPSAHQTLLEEMNKRDDRRHTRIFEILGLSVDIEPECPAGAGYMIGKENE